MVSVIWLFFIAIGSFFMIATGNIELLNEVAEANDYYLVALFVTDIIKKGSYVIYSRRAEDILRKVYKNDNLTQGTFLDGVVSRKKQILPGIMLEMEND